MNIVMKFTPIQADSTPAQIALAKMFTATRTGLDSWESCRTGPVRINSNGSVSPVLSRDLNREHEAHTPRTDYRCDAKPKVISEENCPFDWQSARTCLSEEEFLQGAFDFVCGDSWLQKRTEGSRV